MYIREYGRGDSVFIAFHGWGGTHREFSPLALRMPPNVRLLSFDLPGYGASPEPDVWDLDEIAGGMERELEGRLGSQRRTLVGFCSGHIFCLLLAQRNQEAVERIVMIDPFAAVPWYFRIFLLGEFGRHAYSLTFKTGCGRAVTDWIIGRVQKQDQDFTAAFRTVNHDAVRKYLKLFNQVDVQRFRDLKVDIDILYGESTFGEVRKSIILFQELWPQAGKTALRNVGHLPMVKGARQLASIIFKQERAVHESGA